MSALADEGAAVLARARAQLPAHLEVLARLVEVDTTASSTSAEDCLGIVETTLRGLDFVPARVAGHAAGVSRSHMIADRPARGHDLAAPAPTLLVVGHLDTVLPGGPDTLHRDGARWRGPGVIDMKGGVVTAMLALTLARETGALEGVHVRVALCADEEIGSPTGGPIMRKAARGVDAILCFEAARECGGLVVARKGLGVARIVVHGRSGHAGLDHDRGVNAFTVMCRLVAHAEELERSLSVTVSAGGTVSSSPAALNAIADRASCELEWRFFDPAVGAEVLTALSQIACALEAASGATIVVEGAIEVPPMAPSAATYAMLERYRTVASALGMEVTGTRTAGVGDINELAALGAVCLDGVGPEGGAMHTTDEWLEIDSIARRAAMNAMAIASWSRDAIGALR